LLVVTLLYLWSCAHQAAQEASVERWVALYTTSSNPLQSVSSNMRKAPAGSSQLVAVAK
jgi:hypothetical protein